MSTWGWWRMRDLIRYREWVFWLNWLSPILAKLDQAEMNSEVQKSDLSGKEFKGAWEAFNQWQSLTPEGQGNIRFWLGRTGKEDSELRAFPGGVGLLGKVWTWKWQACGRGGYNTRGRSLPSFTIFAWAKLRNLESLCSCNHWIS